MTEILTNFKSNLKDQIQCYKKIANLEKGKKQALVDNDIQEIESITAQEELILFEVSRLEEERLHWADFFGKELGKKAEEITLADLIAIYPEFEDIKTELESQISEIRDLKEINTKLLENAISIVNLTLNSLTSNRKSTYSKTIGREENKTNNVLFINKDV